MKLHLFRRGFLVAAAGVSLIPSLSQAANIVIGSGADASYFVLESGNLGVRTYEVKYTYDSGASQDAYFLLAQVFASDAAYSNVTSNFGSLSQPNYYVSEIGYNGILETGASAPPWTPYWAHWVFGGSAGYPTASPLVTSTWKSGSGVSAPYRLITPNSWDALFFSNGATAPSVLVPEPSSALLALLGSALLLRRRRK